MVAFAAHLAAFLALALAVADPLCAQSLDSVPAGARLRIARYEPPRIVIGTFIRADSLSVVIMPARGPSTVTMSWSELRRVDISSRQRSTDEAFVRGATTGALIGTGLGLLAIGLAVRADRECNECMTMALVVPASATFTVVTTLVGGVIGMAGREQWRRVWPPM